MLWLWCLGCCGRWRPSPPGPLSRPKAEPRFGETVGAVTPPSPGGPGVRPGEGPGVRAAGLLALTAGLQLLGGHPETCAHTALLSVIYLLVRGASGSAWL